MLPASFWNDDDGRVLARQRMRKLYRLPTAVGRLVDALPTVESLKSPKNESLNARNPVGFTANICYEIENVIY